MRTSTNRSVAPARASLERDAPSRLDQAIDRLGQTHDLRQGLQRILRTAVRLMGADGASVRLLPPLNHLAHLMTTRGGKPEFRSHAVPPARAASPGDERALGARRGWVIVDADRGTRHAFHRRRLRQAGYRAGQITPLLARDGRPLGQLSTWFRRPHRPSAAQSRCLDDYALRAAGFIERCQTEAALRESQQLLRALVNALSANIAVMDKSGAILMVNERWREFAVANHAALGQVCEGANYIQVCQRAARAGALEARRLLTGLRAVLAGRTREFHLEYPCHSPREERWYIARITRLPGGDSPRVVLAHENITERKRAEQALCEREGRLRLALDAAGAGTWSWDGRTRESTWDDRFHALYGLGDQHPRSFTTWVARIHPDDRHRVLRAIQTLRDDPQRDHWDIEYRVIRPDGRTVWLHEIGHAKRTAKGKLAGLTGINIDITERKRSEDALRASTHQIRTLSQAIEQSPASIIITTPTGEITYANRKFAEVSGYTSEEVLGRDLQFLGADRRHSAASREMREAMAEGREWRGEFQARKKSGELYWESAVIAPVCSVDGAVRHYVAIKLDVTERRRGLEALRDREERLRAILNTVQDAIITVDHGGAIVAANPATERLFGYPLAELIGQNVSLLMPSPHPEHQHRYLEHYCRTGKATLIGFGREVMARHRNGELFPVEIAVSEVAPLKLFTGVIRDITRRKRLERELLDTTERVQREFGHELHDGLGQRLTGLEMLSHRLAKRLRRDRCAQAESARQLNQELRETVTQARLISHSLAPVPLDGDGLMRGLSELASRTSRLPGVRCRFTCAPPVHLADTAAATHLYRIAQEAVNNALKHGKAKRVDIILTETAAGIELRIENNGRPLHPDRLQSRRGMGLHLMGYRAGMIGASLTFEPRHPRGARVTCVLGRKT